MLALVLLIFFSFTGFVMNHPGWFDIDTPRVKESELTVPPEVAGAKGEDRKLKVVEYLRTKEGARGEMTAYDDEETSARVQFTGPGRKMEYSIHKEDGTATLHDEVRNTLALMADLHKGTGSGGVWRVMIDGTAIALMFASLSGLVLWLSLPKRRTLGVVALVVSVVGCAGVYWWLVP
jgi:hypothetical protein